VTLCVAGFCDNGQTLVVANDLMVSFGTEMTHSPGLMKGYAFNYSWFGTFAGQVTPFEPIMNRFLKRIEHEPNSFPIITDALVEAYQAERSAGVNAHVMAQCGMAFEEFKKDWKRDLPLSVAKQIWFEIKNFDLGTDFLIGGVDDQNAHHLFSVCNPGRVDHFTGIGFAAIGIGAEHALKMFAFRGYNWVGLSKAQSIYAVLEAKIFGEGPYVGKETILIVLDFERKCVVKWFIPIAFEIRRMIRQGRRSEAEAAIQAEIDKPESWQPLTTL
jgi:hypothetical protein